MGTLSHDAPENWEKILCPCGNRGTFHNVLDPRDGEVYVVGWVIVWFNPETKTGCVQKNPRVRPTICSSCALKARDERNARRHIAMAEKATQKVNKRSWLNRLWG
jgi:hypothetical protein